MPQQSHDRHDAAILVVEDHSETRSFLNLALSDRYRVDCAEDATTALEMTKAKSYDLLLVDIALHDTIDGTEMVAKLRERSEYRHTPMIGMTAHQVSGDPEEYLQRGFDEFLPKPFFPEDLLEAIERLLAGSSGAGPSRRV